MATETSCVGYVGSQRGMSFLGVAVDVAGQAAAAAIPNRIELVCGLLLTQVATRTELAQHGVRRAVTKRLQVPACFIALVAVNNLPRHAYHAAAGVHQAIADRRDFVGMAATTCPRSIVEQSGEPGHSGVGVMLCIRCVIAAMADSAIICPE